MAQEATVRAGLQIRKVSGAVTVLDYQSRPSAFTATVGGTKGPGPGAVSASTEGTDVDLSQFSTPGLCRVMNLDATNYVELGVFDPQTGLYYPLMELMPGESYVFRFSRNVREEYVGTGTGTSAATNAVRLKANGAPVNVLVEAFEA